MSCLTFLFSHILRCICFKILFTESNILFLTEIIHFWWKQSKKAKKSNKKFKIFCVIMILRNHYSVIHYSEIIPGDEGLYFVSNKTNGIKIGLQLYNVKPLHGHQLNRRIANSKGCDYQADACWQISNRPYYQTDVYWQMSNRLSSRRLMANLKYYQADYVNLGFESELKFLSNG